MLHKIRCENWSRPDETETETEDSFLEQRRPWRCLGRGSAGFRLDRVRGGGGLLGPGLLGDGGGPEPGRAGERRRKTLCLARDGAELGDGLDAHAGCV
jgi:hypothetical protein